MLVYEKYIKHKITEYNITKQAKSLDGDGQVLKWERGFSWVCRRIGYLGLFGIYFIYSFILTHA